MAVRALLGFLLLLFLSNLSNALYEDQVGLADWHQKYIGKVKQAVFHTQKTGRRRVVVSTEENIIASLDLRRGDIFWRHVLGKNDPVDQIDIALGKYVVTLSSEGSTLRAWNLPDGLLIWETVLQVSTLSKPLLYVSANSNMEVSLILVFGGGWLHAISSVDGEVIWKKEFSSEGLEIQRVFQPVDSETIFAVGFLGSSQFVAYHIGAKSGELFKHSFESFSSGFSGETSLVSDDMLVALDASRSTIVSIGFQDGVINFHGTHISDLVKGFSGKAELLPSKFNGLFALKTDLSIVMVKVRGLSELKMIDKIDHPASVSDAVSLSGQQAFAMVQHVESKIHITVKLVNDLTNEILKETVAVDRQ